MSYLKRANNFLSAVNTATRFYGLGKRTYDMYSKFKKRGMARKRIRTIRRYRRMARTTPAKRRYAARRVKKTRALTSRTRIGTPVLLPDAKTNVIANVAADTALTASTLYGYDITNIIFGDERYMRQRNLARISGIKVWLRACNRNQNQEAVFNYALLAPKGNKTVSSPSDFESNFFRGYGVDRANDLGSARSGMISCYGNISTDDKVVVYHKRFKLWRKQEATRDTNVDKRNVLDIHRWIPINRMVKWDSSNALNSQTPIWFVYWWDLPSRIAGSAYDAMQGNLEFGLDLITFFRECDY